MSGSFWRKGCSIFGLILGAAVAFAGSGTASEIASASAKRVGHATINEVLINGRENLAAVRAGTQINVDLQFRSDSSAWCPKCSNQIIIGYAKRHDTGTERLAGGKCVYSSSGRKPRQRLRFSMAAPAQPGNYDVVISAPQAYNCTKALRWRARTQSVARINVR